MTLEEMKARKRELGYSLEQLSKLSGVPLGTLQKVFSGQTKHPRRDTIERLTAILEKPQEYQNRHLYQNPIPETENAGIADRVAEDSVSYGTDGSSALSGQAIFGSKKQGEYTIDDYLALPDDKRYELIDGMLIEMDAPSINHQIIAGYLYHLFMNCVEGHNAPCYPYISPLDVQLDKDNRTMVQPDVIIACDPALNTKKRLFGAPEFLAEVISPSSRKRDMIVKLSKYAAAGVKEYWILDPEKQRVIVYLLDEEVGDDISIYSFDDHIPLAISKGICEICLSPVKERLL
ncbi:MAG: Uma2 family endonuclease [Eubacterium sp.]|nr:Uma2 family endonuclease [Eubacterium sp.]